MDQCKTVNSDRSSFDGESDVVSCFIGGIPVGGLFASTVVVAILADTINHIAFGEGMITQWFSIKRISRHGRKKLRNKFIQTFRQLSICQAKTFHSKRCRCQTNICETTGLSYKYR